MLRNAIEKRIFKRQDQLQPINLISRSSSICRGILFGIFLAIASCSKKISPDIIAQVGNQSISVNDFVIDAELYPKWSPDRHGVAALQEHLEKMIERKLIAEEAKCRHLDANPEYQKRRKWQVEDAMVQEIFRREALSKVTVSEQELRRAYIMSLDSIRVRHLFFPTQEKAEAVRLALLRGAKWESIARQTFRDTILAQNSGDLGWMTYGEMDADFELAAHQLKAHEISQPVKTRWGYHLIQVTDRRRQIFMTEEGFAASRPKLEPIIRERKEIAAANTFIAKFMHGRTITIDKKAFTFLINYSRELRRDEQPWHLPVLNDFEIGQIRNSLEDRLNKVLVTFDGGQWTIGEFLERVTCMSGDARPRLTDPQHLPNDIITMVRDKFLAEEGYRRGLEKSPEVKKEVGLWEEDILYNVFRFAFLDTVTVSQLEVEEYFSAHRQSYGEPTFATLRQKVYDDALGAKRQGAWLALLDKLRAQKSIYVNTSLLAEQSKKIETQKPIGFTMVRRRR